MLLQDYSFRGETRVLDAAARTEAPGAFTELADGTVHYELAGPERGQPVVLIHGFSVPCYTWDATLPALVNAGFRVLRYDLYGRGYSDRPDLNYDNRLFERQLLNLIAALRLREPVDLVGLSMGGAIAIHLAARHPALVRRLCLVSPAGLPLPTPWYARFITAPRLGERLLDWVGDRVLVGGLTDDFFRPERMGEYQTRYRDQMRFVGFRRALLSTLRSGLVTGAAEAYAEVGRQERPVLLIWGRHDRVVPFRTSAQVLKSIPQAELQTVEQAGHVSHYEQPEVVTPLLIGFLQR